MTNSKVPVLRCTSCEYQLTIISGPVPEFCGNCGRKLEPRPPATVESTTQTTEEKNADPLSTD